MFLKWRGRNRVNHSRRAFRWVTRRIFFWYARYSFWYSSSSSRFFKWEMWMSLQYLQLKITHFAASSGRRRSSRRKKRLNHSNIPRSVARYVDSTIMRQKYPATGFNML